VKEMTQTHPIVVLSSSCDDNDDSGTTSSSSSLTEASSLLLHSSPIFCDILTLPEIPDDKEPYLLQQNPLNPCGMDNVVILQNLPWHHDGNVLMSLTSCRVLVQDIVFPVEPKPSTFALSFTEESSHMTELDVMFDFAVARTRWNELAAVAKKHHLQDDDDADDDSAFSSNHTVRPEKSLFAQDCMSPPQDRIPPFHNTGEEYCSENMIHASHPDQRIVLARLQAMAEKEAQDLDRLLGVLGILGALLLGLLLWSGHQLYESSKNSDSRRCREYQTLVAEEKQPILSDHNLPHHPESFQHAEHAIQEARASSVSDGPYGHGDPKELVVVQDQGSPPRLLLLITSLSIDRNQVTNQKLMRTLLQSQGFLEMDLLDGADPHHKSRRNELFEISGMRANYPQLFVVAGTKIRFVGDLERVQRLHDHGRLTREELLDREKARDAYESSTILQWPASPNAEKTQTAVPYPTTPPPRNQAMLRYLSPPLSDTETTMTSFEDDDDDDDEDGDSQASSSFSSASSTLLEQEEEASTDSALSDLSPCSKLAREWTKRKTERRSQRRATQAKLQPLAIQWNTGEDLLVPASSKSILEPSQTTPQVIHEMDTSHLEQLHQSHEAAEVANDSKLLPLKERTMLDDSNINNDDKREPLKPAPDTPLLPDLVFSTPGSKEESSFIDDYW
jgi:hypothetical protein